MTLSLDFFSVAQRLQRRSRQTLSGSSLSPYWPSSFCVMELLLQLLLEDRFPRVWVPSAENRDLRQLLWHRHRLVQMRTRIMNQLQAVAMHEGVRRKTALWSKSGRAQLESLPLAPWATRRRHDLLELLDRLNPTIEELSATVEQEAKQR